MSPLTSCRNHSVSDYVVFLLLNSPRSKFPSKYVTCCKLVLHEAISTNNSLCCIIMLSQWMRVSLRESRDLRFILHFQQTGSHLCELTHLVPGEYDTHSMWACRMLPHFQHALNFCFHTVSCSFAESLVLNIKYGIFFSLLK